MNSYSDVDGVPAAADSWLLTEVLRDNWGFTGTVVSDYWAVPFLAIDAPGGRRRRGRRAWLALRAGIDVELPDTLGFGQHLPSGSATASFPEALIDRAAARLLRQKVELGLLDPDWTPEAFGVGRRRAPTSTRRPTATSPARLAERSVVLLDAGQPRCRCWARTDRRLAAGRRRRSVRGRPANLHGLLRLSQPRAPALPGAAGWVSTVRRRCRRPTHRSSPTSKSATQQGCQVRDSIGPDSPAAVAAAARRTSASPFVGDLAGLFGQGTSGEGCDAPDLQLPGVQAELLAALLPPARPRRGRRRLGTPVRPWGRSTPEPPDWCRRSCRARRAVPPSRVFCPAASSPAANCRYRFRVNPGGQPGTYLQPPLGAGHFGTSNLDPTPLFPFGHGRSYTTFALEDLRIGETEIPTDGEVHGDGAGQKHRVPARVTRWSSCTCTTWSPR